MQAGFKANGTLYIKFAMNFAIPLGKGSTNVVCPTADAMKDLADGMVGTPFTLEFYGPVIGRITDYENTVVGHYIFQVEVYDKHKTTVLKLLEANIPSIGAKLKDLKTDITLNPKSGPEMAS